MFYRKALAERKGESWTEILRRRLVECPRCSEVWLVVGARENDCYICKDCEHSFVIIPARQTALEPDEAITVRILLEGLFPEAERAGVLMEVTGVQVD